MTKDKLPSRKEASNPAIEILSIVAMVMEEKYPQDYVILYTIRAWGYRTAFGVRRDHVIATLCISEAAFDTSMRRLRRAGLVGYEPNTGYVSITQEGKTKLLSFQARRSNIWKRMDEYADEQRLLNFTRNKPKPDEQDDQETET